MAEVFGVVVSGITLAQLSGEILSNGLKIKGFVSDIYDAPESLHILLDQLQILGQVFQELDHSHDISVASMIDLPSQASLLTATSHCKKAVERLNSLAQDLAGQIEASRGMRQKIGRIRVVLKKDTLAKYERHLQSAVTLLSLAQQAYVLSWQKIQPKIIAEEIVRGLRARPTSLCGTEPDGVNDCTQSNKCSDKDLIVKPPANLITCGVQDSITVKGRIFKVGIASITGRLEVQLTTSSAVDKHENELRNGSHRGSSVQNKNCKSLGKGGNSSLTIRIRLPSWLTSVVFDSILHQSQRGWTHHLGAYHSHLASSNEWKKIQYAIDRNDVAAIHKLLETRVFHPLDRIYWEGSDFESSFHLEAMSCNSWAISNYLLEQGSELPSSKDMYGLLGARWKAGDESIRQMMIFLRHDGLDDSIRAWILGSFSGDVDAFDRIRRQIWSDDEFFSEAFREMRFHLAWEVATSSAENTSMPAILCHILSPSGIIQQEHIYPESPDYPVMDMLAYVFGASVWQEPGALDCLAIVVGEILTLLREKWYQSISNSAGDYSTKSSSPLLKLLRPSFYALCSDACANQRRKRTLQSRLSHCEKALNFWLEALKSAGFNLLEYGKWETENSENGSLNEKFRVHVDSWNDDHENGIMTIQLLWLQYGQELSDWKLVWSEPTDELAGDFWRLLEPAYLVSLPGAWEPADIRIAPPPPDPWTSLSFCRGDLKE